MSYSLVLESQTEIKPEVIKGLKMILEGVGIKGLKVKKKTNKKPKITWENCKTPLREPTAEEAKVIKDFVENPQLLSADESAKFLQELKMSL